MNRLIAAAFLVGALTGAGAANASRLLWPGMTADFQKEHAQTKR